MLVRERDSAKFSPRKSFGITNTSTSNSFTRRLQGFQGHLAGHETPRFDSAALTAPPTHPEPALPAPSQTCRPPPALKTYPHRSPHPQNRSVDVPPLRPRPSHHKTCVARVGQIPADLPRPRHDFRPRNLQLSEIVVVDSCGHIVCIAHERSGQKGAWR